MRITAEIGIDMGHRVTNHGGKCKNLHGHRYRIEATLFSPELIPTGESEGMITDFGFVKMLMMDVIDKPCDHGTCLWINDPQLLHALGPEADAWRKSVSINGYAEGTWDWGKLYAVSFVPTAENLARHWFERLAPFVQGEIGDQGGSLYSLRVWETPNFSAIYKWP